MWDTLVLALLKWGERGLQKVSAPSKGAMKSFTLSRLCKTICLGSLSDRHK